MTGIDTTLVVAGLALALALIACGLFAWQRYVSPLRAAAADELERDLRGLVREELARPDGQVAVLKVQIARLEGRLAAMEGAAPFPAGPGAAGPAADPQAAARPRGPAPIPADYFEDNRDPRARAPQRNQPPSPPRATQPTAPTPAAAPAPALAPQPAPRPLTHDAAIAFLKNDADYSRLQELYRRCLAGERGALNDFSEMHQPVGVVEDTAGRFVETDDPEPAMWFVEVGGSDTHGVLLPARKAMRDWDKSYRPMSGHKATAVFGSSYDILPGDRLSVTNPAWAQRTSATTFQRVARGELIGR